MKHIKVSCQFWQDWIIQLPTWVAMTTKEVTESFHGFHFHISHTFIKVILAKVSHFGLGKK